MQIPGSQQRLIALCANARGFALASEAIAHLACRAEGVALAFTALLRVETESIVRVAEADERYLRAVERLEEYGTAADSETVLLFAEDAKEARSEFLLALETAYRG
jgi:hypothetical protein